jgi:hypothetical protein
MLDTGPKLRRAAPAREQEPLPPAPPPIRDVIKPRGRVVPLLVTLATVALAVALSWAMWNA